MFPSKINRGRENTPPIPAWCGHQPFPSAEFQWPVRQAFINVAGNLRQPVTVGVACPVTSIAGCPTGLADSDVRPAATVRHPCPLRECGGMGPIPLWAYDHLCLYGWAIPCPRAMTARLSTEVGRWLPR